MKFVATLLFTFFTFSLSFCQPVFQNFETISVDEGLSQNSVYSLYQDRQGFLWIGTADGLNRYDGKQVKIFKAPPNLSEPSNGNFIRGEIVEDKQGNIWYTSENGLYVFDRSISQIKKKYNFHRNELAGSDYKLAFVDSQQVIWMYSAANGFASYQISSGKYTQLPALFTLNMERIVPGNYEVENQNLWFVLHRNDGIYKFSSKTGKITHHWKNQDLRFIKFQRGGYYLVGDQNVQHYDSISAKTSLLKELPIKGADIRDIKNDDLGRAWIATASQQILYYDFSNHLTTRVDNMNLFSPQLLTDFTFLFIDKTQNLWIGTDGAGVGRLNLKRPIFKTISSSNFNSRTFFVKSVLEDRQENIWILTLGNPIFIYSGKQNGVIKNSVVEQVNRNQALALQLDNRGNIWIETEKSLYKIDQEGNLSQYPNTFYQRGEPLPIYKIEYLSNGQIAVASKFGIAFFKENENLKQPFGNSYYVIAGMDFLETSDGTLWIATKNHGLYLTTLDASKRYSVNKNFFAELDINCIHLDTKDSNVLWLASDKGLISFNKTSYEFHLYSEQEGMNDSHVYGILEDNNDNLWCSTNGGIMRFNKTTHEFVSYTVKDGLQNNEFNSGAFFKGNSGNLYFGGVKGLNWFRPEEVEADTATTTAIVSEMFINDERSADSILHHNYFEMPYFKNDLKFRFSILDFSKPLSNKVKYQLKGWDKQPQVRYDLLAQYNNLLPGDYTLVFSASTSNNRWGREQQIRIIILPPFWQRWWFYFLVIVFITGLIVTIVWFFVRQRYKMRIAELEKLNALERERRRISMEMHDDIGANLTRITLISESAKYKSEKEKALDQIANTSRKIMLSISEIIWSLNPDNKTYEQLISYVREQLHSMLEPSGINYKIDLPVSGDFTLSSPLKRNVILILKESVNNAIKHSKGTEILVAGIVNEKCFEFEVTDNGIGFEQENSYAGNGLKNIKSRVAEIKGSIQFISNGKGTTVKIQIPIGNENGYH